MAVETKSGAFSAISRSGAPLAIFPDGTKLPRPIAKQRRKHKREGLVPLKDEYEVPVARPGDVLRRLGARRVFIIDSGVSINAIGQARAEKHLSKFIRYK